MYNILIVTLTAFTFVDAVYTERYMGKPTENSDSYKVSIITVGSITIILSNC